MVVDALHSELVLENEVQEEPHHELLEDGVVASAACDVEHDVASTDDTSYDDETPLVEVESSWADGGVRQSCDEVGMEELLTFRAEEGPSWGVDGGPT